MVVDSILNRIKIDKEKIIIFSFIFFIKICYLIVVFNFSFTTEYFLEDFRGDGHEYLKTSLNLVNNGEYRSEFNDGVTEYVYRMPGMATILTPLLFLFPFSVAAKLFILFQVFLLSIASTYLFLYLKKINRNWFINGALFLFLSIGSYFNQYLNHIIAETISVSLFIIICCYLLQKKEFEINAGFSIICLLFTWLFFLRPFMIVFLPLICVKISDLKSIKNGAIFFLKSNRAVILLTAIIVFFTGLWTLRNYIKTSEVVFMEYSVRADKISDLFECAPEIKNYIIDFGGDFYVTPYNSKTSHLLWFYPEDMLKRTKLDRPPNAIFPAIVFGDKVTIDSLLGIRAAIDSVLTAAPKSKKREAFFEQYKNRLKRAEEVLAKNTNFIFKIKTKKDEALAFLYQPVQDPFSKGSGFFYNLFLCLNACLNGFFISLIIMISIFYFFIKDNFKTYYYIYIPAVFLILLYITYFTVKEQRGLFCYYPAFLVVGMNANNLITSKIKWIQICKVIALLCFVLFIGIYGVYILKNG